MGASNPKCQRRTYTFVSRPPLRLLQAQGASNEPNVRFQLRGAATRSAQWGETATAQTSVGRPAPLALVAAVAAGDDSVVQVFPSSGRACSIWAIAARIRADTALWARLNHPAACPASAAPARPAEVVQPRCPRSTGEGIHRRWVHRRDGGDRAGAATLPSAADCVRFEQESFGALHQMLAGEPEEDRPGVWTEIEEALTRFETTDGFIGPCELLVAGGQR
jgi:hypothetical protein